MPPNVPKFVSSRESERAIVLTSILRFTLFAHLGVSPCIRLPPKSLKEQTFAYVIVYNIVMMIEGLLTTGQASKKYSLTDAHIRRLLIDGTIEGQKLGHIWLVNTLSLDNYMANRPKPGMKKGQRKRRK